MKNWQYKIQRFWELHAVWWILALIPRELKKWIVVQSAVRAAPLGSPDAATYKEMHDVWVKPC